jgi:hypothetical protein
MHKLTAPHCAYDLQLVSAAELSQRKLAAGHNFAITLDGKALPLKPELGHQLVHRKSEGFEIS